MNEDQQIKYLISDMQSKSICYMTKNKSKYE
jgi:hypothetical protein